MLRGFDVSHHQESEDWSSMKTAYGLSFGATKACEGLQTLDARFNANWAGLKSAGLVRGAYYYAHPNQNAQSAAEFFVSTVKSQGLLPTDFFCLDLEISEGIGITALNVWAKAWAARFRELLPGYSPGLYTGHAYMENGVGVGLNGPFGWWWYPRYPNSLAGSAIWPSTFNPILPDPNAWGGPPDIWQYSSSFPVNGEPHDANVFNGDIAKLKSLNGNNMPLDATDLLNIRKEVLAAFKTAVEWESPGVRAWAESLGWADLSARKILEYIVNSTHKNSDNYQQLTASLSSIFSQAQSNGSELSELKLSISALPTADAIADAVVAKLPAPVTGGLTVDDVKAAVKAALNEGVGN